MINLNNTTPAAPTGTTPNQNILWQQDGTGNVSAYLAMVSTKTTVAPSAGVVTIDASLGNAWYVNVNAAITSMVVNNPTDGQELTIIFVQDPTGHAVVLPTNFKGALVPNPTANAVTVQRYTYHSTLTNWYLCTTPPLPPTKNSVAPVAGVLTLDASTGNVFRVNVNAAITSMSITNPTDGQEITILWVQDVTGHTIVLATNLKGATAPSTTANSVSQQRFQYDSTLTNWYATGAGVTGM